MRPEVVGAFRLAMRHEDTAGTLFHPRRPWMAHLPGRLRKHVEKAQKLYARAKRLEAREHVR